MFEFAYNYQNGLHKVLQFDGDLNSSTQNYNNNWLKISADTRLLG